MVAETRDSRWGIRPVNYQDNAEHIQAVLDFIRRIEHGVLN
ncbi:hypothetical protein [Aeromonas salmonicida]|nr:hypothetical protein [Aeromonas salmonicida]UUI62406.1 hypothetical protein NP805_07555 [Aeromonas salmonicida]